MSQQDKQPALNHHALLEQISSAQTEIARYRQRIEKQLLSLQEKDKRIAVLEVFEYSYKKLIAKRQEIQDSQGLALRLSQELAEVNAKKSTALEELSAIRQQFEKLKSMILAGQEELESRGAQILLANQTAAALRQDKASLEGELQQKIEALGQLSREKQKFQELCLQMQKNYEESEAQLKIAQQHLAKKVMETSLAQEKLEDQRTQAADLQSHLQANQTKAAELRAQIEQYQQREKSWQEEHKEALAAVLVQTQEWEDKYYHMYEKWKATEAQSKEWKAAADKYHQMQAFLMNIGAQALPHPPIGREKIAEPLPQIFTLPAAHTAYQPQASHQANDFSNPPEPPLSTPQRLAFSLERNTPVQNSAAAPPQHAVSAELKAEHFAAQKDLFVIPHSSVRYKRNLFDE